MITEIVILGYLAADEQKQTISSPLNYCTHYLIKESHILIKKSKVSVNFTKILLQLTEIYEI